MILDTKRCLGNSKDGSRRSNKLQLYPIQRRLYSPTAPSSKVFRPHSLGNEKNFLTQQWAECLRSLYYDSLNSRQDSIHEHLEGTFEWIWSREDIEFREWLAAGRGIFWVSGMPGSGKSTLMKYLAKQAKVIKEIAPVKSMGSGENEQPLIAAHFFDYKGGDLARSLEGLLRSLLYQVLRGRPTLFEVILPTYNNIKELHSTFSWSLEDLKTVFRVLLLHPDCTSVLVFIDALDEYNGKDFEIAEYLEAVSKLKCNATRFCVSSRPNPDFKFQFGSSQWNLQMAAHVSQDIRTYLSSKFEPYVIKTGYDFGSLISSIVDAAKQNFLWVRLVVDELLENVRHKMPLENLEQRLHDMPHDLEGWYRRTFNEIRDQERHEVERILGIIACTSEPLTIDDLQAALTLSCPSTKIHAIRARHQAVANIQQLSERIEAISNHLLELRPTHKNGVKERVVVFSHHTVYTFISSIELPFGNSGNRPLLSLGNLELFTACISRMLAVPLVDLHDQSATLAHNNETNASKSSSRPSPGLQEPIDKIAGLPLMRYSVMHWIEHAKEAEHEDIALQIDLMHQFSGLPFSLWHVMFTYFDSMEHKITGCRRIAVPSTLLEIAVLCNLEDFVKAELQPSGFCSRIDATHPDATQSLKLAEPKADVNMDNGRLLYSAATGGHRTMINLLFASGAQITPDLQYASSALARAIYRNHIQVARTLLEHGARPDVFGVYIEGYTERQGEGFQEGMPVMGNRPSHLLKATPFELASWHCSLGDSRALQLLSKYDRNLNSKPQGVLKFHPFKYSKPQSPSGGNVERFDPLAAIAKWPIDVATDDVATFADDEKSNEYEYGRRRWHQSFDGCLSWSFEDDEEGPLRRIFITDDSSYDREFWNISDISSRSMTARDMQSSIRGALHSPTVKLDPSGSIESQLALVQSRQDSLGFRPKLDISAFSGDLQLPLPLAQKLYELGYTMSESVEESPDPYDLELCRRPGPARDVLSGRKGFEDGTERYRCCFEDCYQRDQLWPRLDTFIYHCRTWHASEDIDNLIERYEDTVPALVITF